MPRTAGAVADLEPEAIAETLGVSRQTVVRWITSGVKGIKLKAERVGNLWRVKPADLDDFRSKTTEAALTK